MDLFLKDTTNDSCFTWDKLVKELNSSTTYNPFCKSSNFYDVFKHIIQSMIYGREITLLDSDFSDSELLQLTGHQSFGQFTQTIEKDSQIILNGKGNLIKHLSQTSNEWRITLFTSGTTGVPKKVSHNFSSITRSVKASTKNTTNIWGFAYNPTHMAGLQVFFQAILNGNSIVRLFGLSKEEILLELHNSKISHISATPTFYRLLLPCDKVIESVTRITSGGEKFNETTTQKLKQIFPNAKVTNVYASTEIGSLFASQDDTFYVKEKDKHLIQIKEDELLVHKSLLGDSEINISEWYPTGDLVERISDTPLTFKFISRKSDMINVGGYKVNPLEVEDTILELPGIKQTRVYAKNNSVLGNIICCEVVCSNNQLNEASIRSYLQSKLQEFKIPRIIRFTDKLSTTRTGKTKRT